MTVGTVRVVAALIPHDQQPLRFLVQQRLPNKPRPLLWEFPGGKVEPGEDDRQALVRECREELGVELDVTELVGTHRHQYPEIVVELALYDARITRGTPRPLMANDLQFLSPEEMKNRPFCEADVPLLEVLHARSR